MRKKEPKQTAAFVIKPAVVQVWEKAVQEAEDLSTASRYDVKCTFIFKSKLKNKKLLFLGLCITFDCYKKK